MHTEILSAQKLFSAQVIQLHLLKNGIAYIRNTQYIRDTCVINTNCIDPRNARETWSIRYSFKKEYKLSNVIEECQNSYGNGTITFS